MGGARVCMCVQEGGVDGYLVQGGWVPVRLIGAVNEHRRHAGVEVPPPGPRHTLVHLQAHRVGVGVWSSEGRHGLAGGQVLLGMAAAAGANRPPKIKGIP